MAVAVIFGGKLRVVLRLAFAGDRISGVEAIADAERIAGMEVELLEQ
jgi:RNA polymerase sigma-70 factor (ECF subfamily)